MPEALFLGVAALIVLALILGRLGPRWKHRDPKVRLKALAKIRDEGVLTQLAESDPDFSVREKAASRISNEVVLARLFRDPDPRIGRAAVRGVVSHKLLTDLARDLKSNSFVRAAATRRLNDEKVLKELAYEHDPFVREAAVDTMQDKGALARIAEAHQDLRLRARAANRVEGDEGRKLRLAADEAMDQGGLNKVDPLPRPCPICGVSAVLYGKWKTTSDMSGDDMIVNFGPMCGPCANREGYVGEKEPVR